MSFSTMPRACTTLHAAAALLTSIAASVASAQPTLQRIPHLPGGTWEFVSNLSADGRIVAGDAEVAGGSYRAFRWSTPTGTQPLGPAAGHTYSSGYHVSADGGTVVGVSGAAYDIAARWTQATGMVSLGSLSPGQPSFAFAASRDGSVIVGDGYMADGAQRAWKWTAAAGMQELLGRVPGTTHSLALGTNAAATHIIGYCYNNAPALVLPSACMWLPGGGVVAMGQLPGTEMSVPGSITDDGSVAFGYSASINYAPVLPFRWTAASGLMEQLPLLPGATGGVAGTCTADGAMVTGYCVDATSATFGCVWQAGQPVQRVEDFLAARGVSTAGWTFTGASVSSTGSAIAGNGTFQGASAAWYVYLGADCTGAPTITAQPLSQNVAEGSTVTMVAAATGGTITYLWQHDGASVGSSATLVISPVMLSDAGTYTCTVTNACGSTATQSAVLTVTTTCPLPEILQQPVGAQSCGGTAVELFVDAINGDPVEYQWMHDGNEVPGAVDAVLFISNPGQSDAGVYTCRVHNDCGDVFTSDAEVVVLDQCCDSIDYNADGLFPDTADIDDFLNVFSGGACSNDPACGDIDFNNDGLFPDTTDIDALLSVFSGGACL